MATTNEIPLTRSELAESCDETCDEIERMGKVLQQLAAVLRGLPFDAQQRVIRATAELLDIDLAE